MLSARPLDHFRSAPSNPWLGPGRQLLPQTHQQQVSHSGLRHRRDSNRLAPQAPSRGFFYGLRSARVARREKHRQMPLRQLALWMKMVRPLALSRGPSGRWLPGTDSASHAQTRHANGRSRSGWPGSLRSPDECAPPMFRWLLSSSGTGERPTETRALAVGLALPAVHISDVRAR